MDGFFSLRSSVGGVACVTVFNSSAEWMMTESFDLRLCESMNECFDRRMIIWMNDWVRVDEWTN